MAWAKESGLTLPTIDLVPLAISEGYHPPSMLPKKGALLSSSVLIAQKKTDASISKTLRRSSTCIRKKNTKNIATQLYADCGRVLAPAFFFRSSLATDAHHKNWSLIYPDGMTPRLSPAYDLVSTIHYIQDDTLALNLAGSKLWRDISFDSFLKMIQKVEALQAHRDQPTWLAFL